MRTLIEIPEDVKPINWPFESMEEKCVSKKSMNRLENKSLTLHAHVMNMFNRLNIVL